MIRITIIACLLMSPLCQAGNHEYKHLPDFRIPREFAADHNFNPASYLETYPLRDLHIKLSPVALEKLKSLFVAAAKATKVKYNQDYPIKTTVPLYRLLKSHYPDLSKLEEESGSLVFLGDIAKHLMPALDAK